MRCSLFIALLGTLVCASSAENATKKMTIGYLLPISGGSKTGSKMASALPIALDSLNGGPILEGWTLDFVWRDSVCNPGKALKAMTDLLAEDIDLIVGPGCSVACEPTQLLASTTNLPQADLLFCFFWLSFL